MSDLDSSNLVRNARDLLRSGGLDNPHRRGMEQAARGDDAAAIASFEKSIEAVPEAPWSYVALAQVLVRTGARAEAAAAFRDALARTPANAVPLRESIAESLSDIGELEAAIGTFREVLAAEPDRSTAAVGLARALLAQADAIRLEAAQLLVDVDDLALDEGLIALAIEAAPRVPGLFRRLSQSLAGRGDRVRAIAVLQVGLAHDPHDPAALLFLAELLTSDDAPIEDVPGAQRERLLEVVDQAARANPDNDVLLVRRARLIGRHGAPEEAVGAWRAVVAKAPDVAAWRRELGDALAQAGDFEAAGESYDRAVALGYVVY